MRIPYRSEIDGLRAISVFAVIIYHAKFNLFDHSIFQGGFVGVDIFFVISGYLITSLILKEILKKNNFSFKYFYERRVRRLFPVLLFVLIITSIISFFFLLPSSLVNFGNSVLTIIFFASNFFFYLTHAGYSDENSLLRPLLHTWSLSVEEQFYIIFPIFLIIIIKFFRKHIFIILFLVFLISLFFSEYSSKTNPSFNFYMLFTRGFELLAGSLLSYFELYNRKRILKFYPTLNKICPSLGIILILYSFLFFDFTKIFHPSITTLIPLIGVSLIIFFSKKRELITEILSSKIFVFFGLISYSLYLWHYPIFAFLRYIYAFDNSIQIKLLAILLTIILSVLSYYFIEIPFRNNNIISLKKLTSYILISVIILLGYSFYIKKTGGIKKRFPDIIAKNHYEFLEENKLNRAGEKQNNLLLIGDSHSDALAYHLNKELTKESYNFYKKNNLHVKNFNVVNRKTGSANFQDNHEIEKILKNKKNVIVVWHNRWSYILLEEYFDNKEGYSEHKNQENKYTNFYFEPINVKTSSIEQRQKYIINGIKSSAKEILEKGHILILVYSVPEMGFDVPGLFGKKYLISKIFDKKFEDNVLTTSYDVYKERNKMIFNTLDSIKHPNVYRVYPDKYFCNTIIANRCVANSKDHLFYYDDDHLSLEGSKYVVDGIIKTIKQIEINKKLNK
jgi:peptidoglycan/LPS O-acetylase OafA/YrhL